MKKSTALSSSEKEELLNILETRFKKNIKRHSEMSWEQVFKKLSHADEAKLWSVRAMEESGGEPDIIGLDPASNDLLIFDCSPETPAGRRSVCYDRKALDSRKEHKPKNSAEDMAAAMGIDILTESQYRELQKFGPFDTKTSSWIKTPDEIRNLGGALFGDFRYGKTFIYHNGAESYYAARGFRGMLKI